MEALVTLDKIIEMKETTILRLRKIFNKKNERFTSRDPKDGQSKSGSNGSSNSGDDSGKKGKNNGKNGVSKYTGATTIEHKHESLKVGDSCPPDFRILKRVI